MTQPPAIPPRYSPLRQLVLARVREFYREPQAVFWVYGFPILIVVVLGVAFRNQPAEKISVDVEQGPAADEVVRALPAEKFKTEVYDAEICRARFRRPWGNPRIGADGARGVPGPRRETPAGRRSARGGGRGGA